MADASVTAIDGRAVVRVGGSELLAPIVAQAQGALDQINEFTTGPAGPADAFRINLATFKAASITDRKSDFDGSTWYWTTGDYGAAPADQIDVNVIKANSTSLNVGAWVRQTATGVTFVPSGASVRTRTAQDKARERLTILDKVGGVPDGVSSNAVAFEAMFADRRGIVPYADNVYILDRPVTLPAGTLLTHEGSPTIIYTGAAATSNSGILVFGGDGVKIRPVDNSVLTIEATNGNGYLWACYGISINDFEVGNVQAVNCNHWFCTSSAGSVYANVNATNNCKRGRVYGGGARFDAIPTLGSEGACYIGYADDVDIDGCRYKNCVSGLHWWGGDANQGGNGAYGNERKVSNLRIRNVTVDDVALGCLWGSMGRNIRVTDCDVSGAFDVGLDSEGGKDIKFVGCTARRCLNGPAATFFISENVEFINCTLEMENGPCYRSYNSSQSFDSRSVALRGCTFIGTGTMPSTVDANNGPVRSLTIENCVFDFARLSLQTNNLNQVNVLNNRFKFDRTSPSPFDVIATALMHGFLAVGQATVQIARAIIEGNEIYGALDQANGTRAIYVYSDDPTYNVFVSVANNKVLLGAVDSGPLAINIWHAGGNAGAILSADIHDNRTSGPIQTRSTGAATPGNFVGARNMTFALADAPLVGV